MKALESWLASLNSKELSSSRWTAGLLEEPKIKPMLKQLAGDAPDIDKRLYTELHPRMGSLGDFHCQRWYPDPSPINYPADRRVMTDT
jgi:hypothetical protein